MDPVTHTLSGCAIAVSGVARKWGRPAAAAAIIGALLPDIDHFPAKLMGWEWYIRNHRGLTHSVFGLAFMAFFFARAIAAYYKGKGGIGAEAPRRTPIFLILLAASATHVFLDLLTAYGTMVFQPFSDKRFSFNLAFIVDPYITGILLVPLLARIYSARTAEAAFKLALFALAAYLALAAVNRHNAGALARDIFGAISENKTEGIKRIGIYPGPYSPFNWTAIAENGKAYYVATDILRKKNGADVERIARADDEYVEAAKNVPLLKTFFWFAEFPSPRSYERGGRHVVEFVDLRFYRARSKQWFAMRVEFESGSHRIRGVFID